PHRPSSGCWTEPPVAGGNQTADPAVPYGSVSRLKSLKQTGRYSCRAENRLGAAEHTFRLVQPTVPEAPTDVRLAERAGWDHLALAWRPGFAGVSGEDIRQRDRQDPSRVVLNSSQRSDANTRLGRGPPSQSLEVRTAHLALPKPGRVRVEEDGALRIAA
uniref:Ig-like domain-containing protein n=1 Tax=Macrostomum lignano TaxID=282301 RepID=A0A1I8ILD5_9PLAT